MLLEIRMIEPVKDREIDRVGKKQLVELIRQIEQVLMAKAVAEKGQIDISPDDKGFIFRLLLSGSNRRNTQPAR